jgi:sterol desaturase/sphingolipid hydroxylase (fatty acid hydroxylase superfamily)
MWETILLVFFAILLAVLSSEGVGYFLHRLLHNPRMGFLSKNHMTHHLLSYGSLMQQADYVYHLQINESKSLVSVQLEFTAILLTLSVAIGTFIYFSDYAMFILIFIAVFIIWTEVAFVMMHTKMHFSNFWMVKNSITNKWFMRVRNQHVIHHCNIDDSGRLNTNYGICFFLYDKIFGTYEPKNCEVNERNYEITKQLYQDVLK